METGKLEFVINVNKTDLENKIKKDINFEFEHVGYSYTYSKNEDVQVTLITKGVDLIARVETIKLPLL